MAVAKNSMSQCLTWINRCCLLHCCYVLLCSGEISDICQDNTTPNVSLLHTKISCAGSQQIALDFLTFLKPIIKQIEQTHPCLRSASVARARFLYLPYFSSYITHSNALLLWVRAFLLRGASQRSRNDPRAST